MPGSADLCASHGDPGEGRRLHKDLHGFSPLDYSKHPGSDPNRSLHQPIGAYLSLSGICAIMINIITTIPHDP